jgi:hypothetical protein
MLRKIRRHFLNNVVGYIALFVALGGTAYAANTIGSADVIDESLLSQDIKNGEVKNTELGTNSVTSSRIATGNVFTSDLAANSVDGSKVIANSLTGGDIGPNAVATSELANGSVTKAKLTPLGAWSPLPFNRCGNFDDDTFSDANWSNVGGYAPGAVRLDAYGVVHLRGAVQCVADLAPPSLNLIATLPAGSRPQAKEVFAVASSEDFNGAGVNRGAAIVTVGTDGSVTVGGDYHRAFISLSGIEFDALN